MESTSLNFDGTGIAVLVISIIVFLALTILFLPGIIAAALARRRVEKAFRAQAGTIIAHYEPPHNLSPAEVGLLYDSATDNKEIYATLFDLQQRHIIQITSANEVRVLDQTAYHQLPEYAKIAVRMFNAEFAKNDPALKTFPITVLSEHGQQVHTVNLPILNQSTHAFNQAVLRSLRQRGIHVNNYHIAFWARVTILYLIIWALPSVIVFFTGVEVNNSQQESMSIGALLAAPFFSLLFGIFLSPVYFLFAFFAVKLFINIAGRYWINTKQVRRIWIDLEGYRRFLAATDLSRIQFESTNLEHSPTVATLPYAIVLNLETNWRNRLNP